MSDWRSWAALAVAVAMWGWLAVRYFDMSAECERQGMTLVRSFGDGWVCAKVRP